MPTTALHHDEYTLPGADQDEATARRARWDTRAVTVDSDDPIRQEDLARALGHAIGLDDDNAFRDAGIVMDLFGFGDRIIDNILDRADRQFFYILEEEGMLSTDREETTLWDGREWRTHYWQLRKNVIRELAGHGPERAKRRRDAGPDAIYEALPEAAWVGRRF